MNTDRIEKNIELNAPLSRVWRALTNYKEFGKWFGVKLDGPFEVGKSVRGQITYPGFEHLTMEIKVHRIEPESSFSFYWHPYAIDPKQDYSKESPTLVEFRLKKLSTGTLLLVSESGFDALPLKRRQEAFRMNEGGWEQQMLNVETYVKENS